MSLSVSITVPTGIHLYMSHPEVASWSHKLVYKYIIYNMYNTLQVYNKSIHISNITVTKQYMHIEINYSNLTHITHVVQFNDNKNSGVS
jgi:hypothetical protein